MSKTASTSDRMQKDTETAGYPSTIDSNARDLGRAPNRPNEPDEKQVRPSVDSTIPDGGYGWVCVACSVMINAHTWVSCLRLRFG
jgi:hypothetical protein